MPKTCTCETLPPPPPQLLDCETVAKLLCVSVAWVKSPATNPIPRTMVGNRIRFTAQNLNLYVTGQTAAPIVIDEYAPVGRRSA